MINLWTDGGCDNRARAKPGAWAFVVEREGEVVLRRWGWASGTTSNRMELTAALNALLYVREERLADLPVVLYSDSQYLVNGAIDWARRWAANGWITSSGGEVANVDLWRAIMAARRDLHLRWFWVRGHNGTPLNEEADRLCTRGVRRARWRAARARGIL